VTRLLALLGLVLTLVFGLATPGALVSPAQAQQSMNDGPDYEAWENLAERVESALESGEVSTQILEDLRKLIADGRQRFIEAQGTNSSTIRTVRDQLAALGPAPEDGTEPEEIAQQREELNRRLARLEAPVRTAELAQRRAEGLIGAIDEVIRARQTAELLRLGPTPFNPKFWPQAVSSTFNLFDRIRSEVVQTWERPVGKSVFKDNLPAVIALVVIGAVLLARGRAWSVRVMRGMQKDEPSAGRWITSFLISLGEWILPYAGLYALVSAVHATGLTGRNGDVVLENLLPAAFIYFAARWLAQRVFPRHEPRGAVLCLDEACRYYGRLYGSALALVLAAFHFITALAQDVRWTEPVTNVVTFPLVVLNALLLWRIARLLRQHSLASAAVPGGEADLSDRITRILAFALTALAFVSPVLAAIGYMNAAEALLLPTSLSLVLLAALMVLQRFVAEIYVLLTGGRSSDESLVPVLVGFFLILLSLPVFALIWGARPAQLRETWTKITEGVTVGGTTISPVIFLTLALVFALGLLMTRLIQGALKTTILPKTRLDTGGRNAVVSGVGYVGIFLAAIIAITSAGIDLSSLAIVAGALSVGIGFGLQNIVSNFVAGIILLIERPIGEGDWIEVGGKHGYVKAISVRSTRIETFDRTDVIVPNADFVSGTVTNYTRGNTVGRVIVPVGVAYGSDTRKVERILREIAEDHPLVLMNPAPTIMFRGFGPSSFDFEIRAILRDVNWMLNVHSDMNHEIAKRFAEEGIEIPFPQQEIYVRKEAAPTGSPSARAAGEPAPATAAPMQKTAADFDGDGDGGDGGGR